MKISLIVAMSENRVIGRDNQMPWRLSSDLKYFKRLTMGHAMIMGRKTFDSIGRLLPGRQTIILTRDPDYRLEGAMVANSLDHAIQLAANHDQVFIVGGGEIYRQSIERATTIFVTRVHTTVNDGHVTFPEIDWSAFRLTHQEKHSADDKNDFDYTFETYQRNSGKSQ